MWVPVAFFGGWAWSRFSLVGEMVEEWEDDGSCFAVRQTRQVPNTGQAPSRCPRAMMRLLPSEFAHCKL